MGAGTAGAVAVDNTLRAVVAGVALGRPNDLAFGPDGRLWFTDPNGPDDPARNTEPGRIFVLDVETGRGELVIELRQPGRIDHAVVIGERDNVPGRVGDAAVAGPCLTRHGLEDVPDSVPVAYRARRLRRRAIVDDDDLVRRRVEGHQARQAALRIVRASARADDDGPRDRRPGPRRATRRARPLHRRSAPVHWWC